VRADPSDLLVLLGDLVNKGPKSREVVARARRAGALAVRGNHDDAALAALAARNAARGSSCGTARSTLVVAAEVAVGAEDGAAAAAGGGSVVKGGKQTTKEMRGEKGGKKEGKHFATVYDWVEGMGQADVNYLAGLPHTISLPFLDPPVSSAPHLTLSSRTRACFACLFFFLSLTAGTSALTACRRYSPRPRCCWCTRGSSRAWASPTRPQRT